MYKRQEEERSGAAVNRSNYIKLAKKVVYYKKLYRASKKKAKSLAEQNIRMSDLASKHLKASDGMTEELSEKAKLVADLKQRMELSESSDKSSLVTTAGQRDSSEPERQRVNRPR